LGNGIKALEMPKTSIPILDKRRNGTIEPPVQNDNFPQARLPHEQLNPFGSPWILLVSLAQNLFKTELLKAILKITRPQWHYSIER